MLQDILIVNIMIRNKTCYVIIVDYSLKESAIKLNILKNVVF